MLQICWVNQHAVSPAMGGGTRHWEFAEILGSYGCRTTLLASDFHLASRGYQLRPSAWRVGTQASPCGIGEVRWLWAAPYRRNNVWRGVNWLSFAGAVGMASLPVRPDVVIGSSPQPFAALGAYWLSRRLRRPFILELRDLWPESLLAAGGRKGPMYRVIERVMHLLYARASAIIVLADGTGRRLVEQGVDADRIWLIPNGVSVLPLDPPAVRRRRVVYAGAHGPANGLDTVLRAARGAQDEGLDLTWEFIGDGPVKAELVAAAAAWGLRNCVFRPPMAKPALFAYLRESLAGLMVLRPADLFQDAISPNKLFDYFGVGLPVVTNVPGEVAGIVSTAGGGVVAEDAGADALLSAVRKLAAQDASTLDQMGRAGHAWVSVHRNRAVIAQEFAARVRGLIGATGPQGDGGR